MGVCITTLAEDIAELDPQGKSADFGEYEIGRLFSAQFFLLATLSPILMLLIFNQKQGLKNKLVDVKDDIPVCLLVGFIYSIAQYVTARYMGPKLPCLLAGGTALIFYILFEKWRSITWILPQKEAFTSRKYLIPLVLLITILVLYGVVPGAESALTGEGTSAEKILNPTVFYVNSGGVYIKRTFDWLYHSGVVVFVIAVLTPFILPYKKIVDPELTVQTGLGVENGFTESSDRDPKKWKKHIKQVMLATRAKAVFVQDSVRRKKVLKTALEESIGDAIPVLLSITSFASIAKLMSSFGMTTVIALKIVSALESVPAIFAFFMPVIGMLGSALTGSTTTSNFLFARLQVSTVSKLGLLKTQNSIWEVAGLQILGASAGEIISPMNAVVITLMDGVKASESELAGRLLKLTGIWLLICMLTSITFLLAPGLD